VTGGAARHQRHSPLRRRAMGILTAGSPAFLRVIWWRRKCRDISHGQAFRLRQWKVAGGARRIRRGQMCRSHPVTFKASLGDGPANAHPRSVGFRMAGDARRRPCGSAGCVRCVIESQVVPPGISWRLPLHLLLHFAVMARRARCGRGPERRTAHHDSGVTRRARGEHPGMPGVVETRLLRCNTARAEHASQHGGAKFAERDHRRTAGGRWVSPPPVLPPNNSTTRALTRNWFQSNAPASGRWRSST